MNIKVKFYIILLIFLVLISISWVSASDNITYAISTENSNEIVSNGIYNNGNCDSLKYSYNESVKSNQELEEKSNVLKKFEINGVNSNTTDNELGHSEGENHVLMESWGNDKSTLGVGDGSYLDISDAKLIITSSMSVKLNVKQISTTKNKYFTIKATVKDKSEHNINEGFVKFNINGKTYKEKVKNGIASKKLKLSKVKTYNVKTTFSAQGYKEKTVSSKVIIKNTKVSKSSTSNKVHYIKKGKYSFKVTESQFKKIQYVKNHKYDKCLSKYANFKVKTGKYYKGLNVYAIVTTWSGIRSGHYYNYPQVQFVVMYGKNTWDWDYLTNHYTL